MRNYEHPYIDLTYNFWFTMVFLQYVKQQHEHNNVQHINTYSNKLIRAMYETY